MPDGIKIVLFRIIAIAVAFLFFQFGFDWRYGALLACWIIMTWFILRAYDDWGTLLKRCVLSLPFIALLELGLYAFIRPEHYTYWYSAAILFDALLLNVPKTLPHYITTLFVMAASILLVQKQLDAGIGSYTYSSIFLVFFCASYLLILNRNKDKYISILIKSTISGMLVLLLAWIFMTSGNMIDRHNISSGYAYAFLCFLGLIFFLVFYALGKKYFKANNLFKKGKILKPFEDFPTR